MYSSSRWEGPADMMGAILGAGGNPRVMQVKQRLRSVSLLSITSSAALDSASLRVASITATPPEHRQEFRRLSR